MKHVHNHHCDPQDQSCHPVNKTDWLLWISLLLVGLGYLFHVVSPLQNRYVLSFSGSIYELLNKMWWGLGLGVLFIGLIGMMPREVIVRILGRKKGLGSILRATLAGVLLDLCSHGILLVAMKLYERGARIGQVIAFLVASPWNSLSLTVILWSLVGWKWTLVFIGLSMVIAVISGMIFEMLTVRKILPENPFTKKVKSSEFSMKELIRKDFKKREWTIGSTLKLIRETLQESQKIMRWIFFGIVIASLIRTFVPMDVFATYFGPTLLGLAAIIVIATILEVCSEGSVPIASDLLTRALAPGNAFTFLMTGVATDYTEIMALKETTKSWKIALFLPLVTVPQIVLLGYIINNI